MQAAVAHHRAGRVGEAEAGYKQILAQHPNHANALYLLGLIQNHYGKREQAVDLILRAISAGPGNAEMHQNLGLILAPMGRIPEAIVALQSAIRINPQFPTYHYDLANIFLAANDLDGAIKEYRAAVSLNPNFAEAHQNLGVVLQRRGFLDEAEAHLRKAISLQPNMADAYNNLGGVLTAKVKLHDAIAAYEQAMRLRPDFAGAMANLGSNLRLVGRLADALKMLRRAIELSPNMPEALNNYGIALKENGQLDEAVIVYQRCLALRPTMPDTTNNLGNAHKDCGNVHDAIACYARSIVMGMTDPGVHSNLVYTLQFHPGYDDESLYREQRRWNEIFAQPVKHLIRPHDNDRSPDRKLKIGYVSPYFYHQAESFFVAPLLEQHDKENFEIHCYASVIRPDPMTQRHRAAASVWHDVLGVKDPVLAEKIRADRIDVLIDLAMHMSYNRMLCFAHKPAPVQVAWLAYPGGTGLDAMDYRITDGYMDPPDKSDANYREYSYRVPDCWCCYHPLCDVPPAAPRNDGPICFGSINNPCKNHVPMLTLWARLMSKVPESRLLMQSFSNWDRNRIRSIFQEAGIAAERIEFVPRKLRNDYLRLYDTIDICLDPLPYNGITTTCDALWMGVPVVTLAGRTAAGRAGVSILSTLGLPELIAHDEQQFLDITTSLAGDRARLTELRQTLRKRTEQSPLMDARGFARKMETAYRFMWQRWCEQK
jgi:predicted O-linked N-acetylglucosamine transferase (SPINDLY family)